MLTLDHGNLRLMRLTTQRSADFPNNEAQHFQSRDSNFQIDFSIFLISVTIVSATFLQKIGLTFGSFQFYFSLVVLYLVGFLGLITGTMEIHLRRGLGFSICFGTLIIEQFISGKDASFPSLALLLVVNLPYVLNLRNSDLHPDRIFRIFQNIVFIIAILGIVQYFGQFVVGSKYAFFLDYSFPSLIIKMANISPESYGSSTLRSTGVFMLEPSLLSQYCAISIIIEFLFYNRLKRLFILSGAILCSAGGTGIMLLILVVPMILIRQKRLYLLIAASVSGVVVFSFSALLGLGHFANRITEFNSTGTSSYARFFSPFPILRDMVFTDVNGLLFGLGAGSYKYIVQTLSTVNYAIFYPSWAKMLVEYGIVGFIAYFSFIGYCIFSSKQDFLLKFAIFFQFTVLAGYVHVPPEHALILSLLVWARNPFEKTQKHATDPGPDTWSFGKHLPRMG